MIKFNYESDYQLVSENVYTNWIKNVIRSEEGVLGAISYIFCDDSYLLEINQKYLQHDTYTDIITFDYTEGVTISGDIFISIDRVKENALAFEVSFEDELLRVMAHGVLHLSGYGDKSDDEKVIMRSKEEKMIKLFHVEQ